MNKRAFFKTLIGGCFGLSGISNNSLAKAVDTQKTDKNIFVSIIDNDENKIGNGSYITDINERRRVWVDNGELFTETEPLIFGKIDTIVIHKKYIKDLFMREFIHPKSQISPIHFKLNDPLSKFSIKIKNVWINNFKESHLVDDGQFVLIHNVEWDAEKII